MSAGRGHRVAVIGGDGIGPEVLAEALKVVARPAWPSTRPTTTSAPRATCAPARCSPTPSWRSCAASTRSCSARSGRRWATPRSRPGPLSAACLLRLRFELDLYVNLRPFTGVPGLDRRGCGLRGRPGEHRGHLRRGGGVPAQGHALRGGDPGLGQHPLRGRALRPLRLRAGRNAPSAKHLTLVHKTNVLTFAGRPVAADLRRGGAGVPRRSPATTTTSTPPASTWSSSPPATT